MIFSILQILIIVIVACLFVYFICEQPFPLSALSADGLTLAWEVFQLRGTCQIVACDYPGEQQGASLRIGIYGIARWLTLVSFIVASFVVKQSWHSAKWAMIQAGGAVDTFSR